MKIIDMGHNGKRHFELQLGFWGLFLAYNEFVVGLGFRMPPQTQGVKIFRLWRFEFGWW